MKTDNRWQNNWETENEDTEKCLEVFDSSIPSCMGNTVWGRHLEHKHSKDVAKRRNRSEVIWLHKNKNCLNTLVVSVRKRLSCACRIPPGGWMTDKESLKLPECPRTAPETRTRGEETNVRVLQNLSLHGSVKVSFTFRQLYPGENISCSLLNRVGPRIDLNTEVNKSGNIYSVQISQNLTVDRQQ